jgi:hypothetical protein
MDAKMKIPDYLLKVIFKNVLRSGAFLILLSSPSLAATIFSVTGIVDANPAILTDNPGTIQFVTGSWSQTIGISDATIRAQINGTGTMIAFLTNQIGAGTTQVANEIANATFSVSGAPQSNMATIFTGLTLGPGTYFLTIYQSPANQGISAGWVADRNPVVTGTPFFTPLAGQIGGSGVGGMDGTYIPASSFAADTKNGQPVFQLMDISVPEPSTHLTSGVALLLLAGLTFVRRVAPPR